MSDTSARGRSVMLALVGVTAAVLWGWFALGSEPVRDSTPDDRPSGEAPPPELRLPAQVAVRSLQTPPAPRAEIIVKTIDGEVLVGADVLAYQPGEASTSAPSTERLAITDAGGRATVVLPTNRHLAVNAAGFVAERLGVVAPGTTREVVLGRGSNVRFVCRRANGSPVSGALIRMAQGPMALLGAEQALSKHVDTSDFGPSRVCSAASGADGVAEFRHVAPGQYGVEVLHDDLFCVAHGLGRAAVVQVPLARAVELEFVEPWVAQVQVVGDEVEHAERCVGDWISEERAIPGHGPQLIRMLGRRWGPQYVLDTLQKLRDHGRLCVAQPVFVATPRREPQGGLVISARLLLRHRGLREVAVPMCRLSEFRRPYRLDVSADPLPVSDPLGEVSVVLRDVRGIDVDAPHYVALDRVGGESYTRVLASRQWVRVVPGDYDVSVHGLFSRLFPKSRVQIAAGTTQIAALQCPEALFPCRIETLVSERQARVGLRLGRRPVALFWLEAAERPCDVWLPEGPWHLEMAFSPHLPERAMQTFVVRETDEVQRFAFDLVHIH